MEYLQHFRQDMAVTEADRVRLIDEYRQKADEEAYRKRQELKQQKKDMEKVYTRICSDSFRTSNKCRPSQDTYAAMWRRISENRERNIIEYKERLQEAIEIRAELQRNAVQEREADEQRRREILEYGRELKQQDELVRLLEVRYFVQI